MRHTRAQHLGVTLIEAMVLMVILSIVAVAAGVGLQAVVKVPAIADDTLAVNNVIVSAMEQTRANLTRNWPTGTWGGTNFSFMAAGTSYTPSTGLTLGTTGAPASGFATPTSGSSPAPITINNKRYRLTLALDRADPAAGSSYQADFLQVSVSVAPIIGGLVDTSAPQKVVTYVAAP